MAGYSSRVHKDIGRWLDAGLIDPIVAEALRRDVEEHARRSLSFGSILAIMAALLLGAAILVFVASNWEAIPRIGRVGSLFAIILAGYVGGAVLKVNDHAAIGKRPGLSLPRPSAVQSRWSDRCIICLATRTRPSSHGAWGQL